MARTSADPAQALAATIDLDAWLGGMAHADRELLAGRLAGFSLQVALRSDRSVTAVFQRLRQLGTDLVTERYSHLHVYLFAEHDVAKVALDLTPGNAEPTPVGQPLGREGA